MSRNRGAARRPASRVVGFTAASVSLLLRAIDRARRGLAATRQALGRPPLARSLAGSALFAALFLLLDPAPPMPAPFSRALYAEGGELLGASVAEDGQWRFAPSAGALPDRFVMALVAYEDKRFFGHAGFDPLAIFRAARDNLAAGRVVSGGSTLSMQAARLSRPASYRTLPVKLAELWSAVRMELFGYKKDILERYAARAPFGGNVVGLEGAGFRWFGRPVSMLTWAEAAMLAVLPNNPGAMHPGRLRDSLLAKRNGLLAKMADAGIFGPEDLAAALREPMPLEPVPMPTLAQHLCAASPPGRTVSTLDYSLQSRARALVERHGRRLAQSGIANAAAVVLRVADGSAAAWVGNVEAAGAAGSSMVDCAIAPRSSGSVLKPFLYAAMLDSGELTPSRLIPDIPTRVGSYSPENNLKTYSGAVRADTALARSLNVPFVRLLRSYGVERFAGLLKRLGLGTLARAPADYGLTLILGGAEIRLAEAAGAYASLARMARPDGREKTGGMILGYRWTADRGRMGSGEAPFSRGAAWLTLEALVKVARPGDEASWQEYASSLRVAWKTGTSFGSRDAWAIGVTAEYAVAVWVGNASGEGRPEIKGSDAAAPLLFELFGLLPRAEWFPEPRDGLKAVTVCAESGYAAGQDCATTTRELVPAGAVVDKSCPYCALVALSSDGSMRVSAECAGESGLAMERRFILPPAMEWYFRRANALYRPLPPWKPGCAPSGQRSVEFIAPEEGAAIYVPIELDGSPGMTVFRVAHRDRTARLFWHLDGDYLGETRGDHRMEARPAPGEHELRVVDESGSGAVRRFTVLSHGD